MLQTAPCGLVEVSLFHGTLEGIQGFKAILFCNCSIRSRSQLPRLFPLTSSLSCCTSARWFLNDQLGAYRVAWLAI